MTDSPSERPRWLSWRNFDACAIRLVMIAALGFVGYLLFRITTTHTTPSTDSEAMIQMAQWTIAVILTAGGALIGINWYQSERCYQRDIDDITKANEDRFQRLEVNIRATTFAVMITEIRRQLGEPERREYFLTAVKLYHQIPDMGLKREIILDVLDATRKTASHHITKVSRRYFDVLYPILPQVKEDMPDLGDDLDQALQALGSPPQQLFTTP